ncbi:hypothetical protein Patl1_19124 [Pistacia atlantica]|uniref:Uncharacterized protein n=1 Tax=Pistacia atlantica TaxID=434234 RepID=A0ACC1C173_9ROSI|nr:hypothetical protein Patl1_19124 [Pistacia atlantica]
MPALQSLVNFPPVGPQASIGTQFPPNSGPQAPYGVPVTGLGNGWHSELFDCMNDPMNALVTILFPYRDRQRWPHLMWDERNAIYTGGLHFA